MSTCNLRSGSFSLRLETLILKTNEDFNQFTAVKSVIEMDRNGVPANTRNQNPSGS
jgi:hypothetical protein